MRNKLALLLILLSTNTYADNQWVYGYVETLEDYAGYSAGQFEVLITLNNKEWLPPGNGATLCTDRFKLKVCEQGMTEEAKNRIYSTLLAAYLSTGNQTKVGLYVIRLHALPK